MAELVRLEVADGVGTVVLDRPERHNAFSDEMDRQMWAAFEQARDRDDVRAIVWRGEGPSFSSGRDLAELGQRPDGVSDLDYIRAGHERTRLLFTLPKPIVVALHGWVIGGSFERALLADLRIAAEDTRMRLPEVEHGVLCDSAGTARLFQMAGHGLASDLVLTGRVLGADEALAHGVVSRVVPAEQLAETAHAVAAELARRDPTAMRLSLDTLRSLASPAVEQTLDRELVAQAALMGTPAYRDRRAAAAARRAAATAQADGG